MRYNASKKKDIIAYFGGNAPNLDPEEDRLLSWSQAGGSSIPFVRNIDLWLTGEPPHTSIQLPFFGWYEATMFIRWPTNIGDGMFVSTTLGSAGWANIHATAERSVTAHQVWYQPEEFESVIECHVFNGSATVVSFGVTMLIRRVFPD